MGRRFSPENLSDSLSDRRDAGEQDLFDASARKYGYDAQQFYAIAENLRKTKLIDLDKFGFYSPTARGEELIQEIFRHCFPVSLTPATACRFSI